MNVLENHLCKVSFLQMKPPQGEDSVFKRPRKVANFRTEESFLTAQLGGTGTGGGGGREVACSFPVFVCRRCVRLKDTVSINSAQHSSRLI